jgi:hypothetical protein
MITVNVCGGIGNTLFQYAYARTLPGIVRLLNNCTQYGCQLSRFNINLSFTSKPEGRWISEKGLPFDPSPEVEDPSIQNGYWQCDRYFSNIENEIRKEITLKEIPSNTARKYAEQILSSPNSVMLHIRHGDYLTWAKERHGVLPVEYYLKAIEHFTNPNVFLFSDDPNCSVPVPHTRVYCAPHEDLWLMSKCRHAIIANSSFSWWGAWLGADKTGTVIAPKQWFAKGNEDARDIIPVRWIRI